METTVDNQVAIINNSIEIFRSAPEILKQNQERTSKALSVGNDILIKWQDAWNIESEDERMKALASIDERSNNYLVNCGNALKSEKEMRAAITQMMDEFKKMFTSSENDIDKSKPNTIPAKVQNWRDTFAQESFNIQEQKRQEAERAAAKAKEIIDIRAKAEVKVSNEFNNHLLEKKKKMVDAFNTITLENFEAKSTALKNHTPAFTFVPSDSGIYATSYHTKEEVAEVVKTAFWNCEKDYTATTIAELNLLRDELIEKLPSKKSELDEQKRLSDEAEAARKQAAEAKSKTDREAAIERQRKADQAEAQQQEERKRREEEENARLAKESEDAKMKAEQEAEIKKQGEQTMVMFEQEAALADAAPVQEARQGYEITVLHQAAFVQIFQLWFEQEGKNLTIDKIGNTKLDQMKAWAEKYAQKTGTKIESKFLKYEESFKAVNRKAK